MDTTVWVAIIVAVSTLIASLGATWLNNLSSNKRFQIELGRAIDVDHRTRRWQVRSEPLLKLRTELAEMALWGERLVNTMGMVADAFKRRASMNGEDKLYEESYQHFNAYIQSGIFEKTLYCIGDKEIREKALTLSAGYTDLWLFVKNQFTKINPPDLTKVIESTKIIADHVMELQALINDRLEKL